MPAHVVPNAKAKREEAVQEMKRGERGVWIIHYEALALIDWKKIPEWGMVVADEAHRLKNGKAKQTRAIKKIPTQRKLALSGTIIANHAEELFSPLQWLLPGPLQVQVARLEQSLP